MPSLPDRREFLTAASALPFALTASAADVPARTTVSIQGDEFHVNGRPTYEGRHFRGQKIQGLLLNSRMVQGLFDDRNLQTRSRWQYPDTKAWDPQRNTREFVAWMPDWRRHGLLAFTLNLQGGNPQGYGKSQPWETGAFEADGTLRPAYLARLERILTRADELGMVVILGYFYFGQDQHVKDEAAIRRGTADATEWLMRKGYRNVLVEIANECDNRAYDHDLLRPGRVVDLLQQARSARYQERRLLVAVSFNGGVVPPNHVVAASDFVLLHGNGVKDPARIADMVARVRKLHSYRPMPILFNEDDHFDFDQPSNNRWSALSSYASWGYFDPGQSNYRDGYQSPPVNWRINTERKKAFFSFVKEVAGT